MNPFVLEADRVDRIAIVGPGPTVAVVDTDAVRDRMRFVANVDFSRRVFQLDVNDLDLDPQVDRRRRLRGVARPCARRDRGRDDRHRPPHLRHGARVREGARAVRPADRLVPGDPAQARRHVARARTRDRGRAVRRDDRATPRPAIARSPATRPRPRRARRRGASSRTARRSTVASATRGSTTCISTCGAPPPTRTCSAPRAGTSIASPTCCSQRAENAACTPRRPAGRGTAGRGTTLSDADVRFLDSRVDGHMTSQAKTAGVGRAPTSP